MSAHGHPSTSSQQPHLSNILAPASQPANTERTESEIQADDGGGEGEQGQNADRSDSSKGKEKDKEYDKWIQGIDYAYEYVPVTQRRQGRKNM